MKAMPSPTGGNRAGLFLPNSFPINNPVLAQDEAPRFRTLEEAGAYGRAFATAYVKLAFDKSPTGLVEDADKWDDVRERVQKLLDFLKDKLRDANALDEVDNLVWAALEEQTKIHKDDRERDELKRDIKDGLPENLHSKVDQLAQDRAFFERYPECRRIAIGAAPGSSSVALDAGRHLPQRLTEAERQDFIKRFPMCERLM